MHASHTTRLINSNLNAVASPPTLMLSDGEWRKKNIIASEVGKKDEQSEGYHG